jgi:hypothetical protein
VKANLITALILFFLGAFGLIVVAVRTPGIEFYTGGIFIALFIASLLYVLGNTIRQGNEMKDKEPVQAPVPVSTSPPATEQSEASQTPEASPN